MHQTRFSPYEEEGLVARCLHGEDTAWEVMFRLYHPRLVSIIKAEMNWHCSTDQAEEIAASIWCSPLQRDVLSPPAVRSSGWWITHLPQGPEPARNLEENTRGEESPISGTPFRSQRGGHGRYRTRDRCQGIPGHPDLPGTRVLQVLSHETIRGFRPISSLLHQLLETPKPGPEEVSDVHS